MSNVYKFCGCRTCRANRRSSHDWTRKTMRSFRRKTREAIRQGKEPPTKVSIPYTD
jgi:hypothetical protein